MPKDTKPADAKKKDEPKDERAESVPPTEKRYVLVELSCDFKHCNPCTYPNCQRFIRETKKKTPFSSRIFEVSKDEARKKQAGK